MDLAESSNNIHALTYIKGTVNGDSKLRNFKCQREDKQLSICYSKGNLYSAEHMITYRPSARVAECNAVHHFSFPKGIYADGYYRL